jgi:hypothetical protein
MNIKVSSAVVVYVAVAVCSVVAFVAGFSSRVSVNAQTDVVVSITRQEAVVPGNVDWLAVSPWPSSHSVIFSREIYHP